MSKLLQVKILTLFPELFPGPLDLSITGRALKNKIWSLETIDIRSFALDKHRTVDGSVVGGGIGMILRPDILEKAIDYAKADSEDFTIIYMSPRGEKLTQRLSEEFVREQNKLIIICGRFEGIDQRVIDHYNIKEISIGDYVLTGGEIAAYVFLDSCIRLLPGALSDNSLFTEESFGSELSKSQERTYLNLLEYPQYTKPISWKNKSVPDILLSGHHKNIKKWNLEQAEKYTETRRPDLWELYKKNNKLS